MGEDREGSFHPAAFLYTVKKGSMVDLGVESTPSGANLDLNQHRGDLESFSSF